MTPSDADRIAIATDPDIAHLLDLLRRLPGPTEDRHFWAAVQTVWQGRQIPDEPSPRDLDYVYGKMAHLTLFFRKQSLNHLRYLCQYLLILFGNRDPEMWRVLGRVTSLDFSIDSESGGTGRLWAEDVTRTAWALLIRYDRAGDETWEEKWEFVRASSEWLPGRGRPNE